MDIKLNPIGYIFSPFESRDDINPLEFKSDEHQGTIEINKDYVEALDDLDEFSHIIVIFYFHKEKTEKLKTIPLRDKTVRGIFATRSPKRPNHIGMSVVELLDISDNIITFRGVDMLNSTPVLDIKPYIKRTDKRVDNKEGWLDKL